MWQIHSVASQTQYMPLQFKRLRAAMQPGSRGLTRRGRSCICYLSVSCLA
jgi:hypothetical protein